jgi:hypothetical protein
MTEQQVGQRNPPSRRWRYARALIWILAWAVVADGRLGPLLSTVVAAIAVLVVLISLWVGEKRERDGDGKTGAGSNRSEGPQGEPGQPWDTRGRS